MQIGDDGERDDPASTTTTTIRGREVTVEFVHHAADRLRTRGITVEEVLRCLRAPDDRDLDCDEGRKRVGRYGTDGRRLDVVYEVVTETRYTVISAFWVSRGRR